MAQISSGETFYIKINIKKNNLEYLTVLLCLSQSKQDMTFDNSKDELTFINNISYSCEDFCNPLVLEEIGHGKTRA